MVEERAHHIVCEYPAIKSIRVRLYWKPLLLPETIIRKGTQEGKRKGNLAPREENFQGI